MPDPGSDGGYGRGQTITISTTDAAETILTPTRIEAKGPSHGGGLRSPYPMGTCTMTLRLQRHCKVH